MEEHFLNKFVLGEQRSSGRAEPWYNPHGDCVIFQVVHEATVADRIDDILTIYRSVISDKPIGYQIKGIAALAQKFGYGIIVEHEEDGKELKSLSISAVLLAAYEQGPKTIGRRMAYANAFESFANSPRLQMDELQPLLG